MLTGELFHIIGSHQKSENEYQLVFCCNIAHPVFKGHFPDSPVLPGVCMIQLVREELSDFLKKDFSLFRARSIKFVNVINPVKEPKLMLELKINTTEDGLTDVSALIKSDTTSFFQFRGQYKKPAQY